MKLINGLPHADPRPYCRDIVTRVVDQVIAYELQRLDARRGLVPERTLSALLTTQQFADAAGSADGEAEAIATPADDLFGLLDAVPVYDDPAPGTGAAALLRPRRRRAARDGECAMDQSDGARPARGAHVILCNYNICCVCSSSKWFRCCVI